MYAEIKTKQLEPNDFNTTTRPLTQNHGELISEMPAGQLPLRSNFLKKIQQLRLNHDGFLLRFVLGDEFDLLSTKELRFHKYLNFCDFH